MAAVAAMAVIMAAIVSAAAVAVIMTVEHEGPATCPAVAHLKHWRDTSPPRNHADRIVLVGLVSDLEDGTLEIERVARLQTGKVLAHLALRIHLDLQ